MRSISFMTKWNQDYEGPLVAVYVNDTPVALALPHMKDMELKTEDGNAASYHDLVCNELSKSEYGLHDHEIDAIIEFLSKPDNFGAFSKHQPEKTKEADFQVAY